MENVVVFAYRHHQLAGNYEAIRDVLKGTVDMNFEKLRSAYNGGRLT